MTDERDDFGRQLSGRLAASEARVPAGAAPDPEAVLGERRWPTAAILGGVASVAVLAAAVLAIGLVPDRVGDASPTPSAADTTSAAGLTFVLPPGWDYRLPPEEYSVWAMGWTVAPRIYFSNAAMLDDPICGAWTSLRPAFTCGVIDQLPDDGVVVSWTMRREPLPLQSGSPDIIAGQEGMRADAGGACSDIGADRAEQIAIRDPSGAQNLLLICSRNASSTTLSQVEDLLDSMQIIDTVPSPTASPTESAAHESMRPTAAPSSAQPTELEWVASGSFPGSGGPAIVQDIVAVDDRLVAVGISYTSPLPAAGPTPAHRARVWGSSDGRTWEEVALSAQFANVDLRHLIARGDGSLLALGYRSGVENDQVTDAESAAWSSIDGRSWVESTSGLPVTPADIAVGAKGYIAVTPSVEYGEANQVWFSADAAVWEMVRALDARRVSIAAGDEGFVITGVTGNDDSQPFVLASGDGRSWFEGATPPRGPFSYLAPRGGDWIAVTTFGLVATNGEVWFSANGLDWSVAGLVEMRDVELDGGGSCFEFPRALSAAGDWLILSTDLSGPCSEGGYAVHGTTYGSLDGREWMALPFPAGTPGESRSGSSVSAGATWNGMAVLAGERDSSATFWTAEGN